MIESIRREGGDDGGRLLSNSRVYYWLISILGLALFLRVWGISFGLPYDFTPDEIHEIVRALKLGAGEYSWTPGKGGLYYFLFVEYGLIYVYWRLSGHISGPEDFAILYLQDPTAFYLAGRLTVAVMGVITCLIVFIIGRRLYGRQTGLIAAFLGATAYFHTLWSHYINVDIGMTLAFWCAILSYLLFEEQRKYHWLIASGAFAAVAFAFKLPGIFVLFPLVLLLGTRSGCWREPRKLLREVGVLVIAMILVSAVTAPENLLAIGKLPAQFSNLVNKAAGTAVMESSVAADSAFDEAVKRVTVLRGGSYLEILLRHANIVLTLAALAGAVFGLIMRNRWDITWAVLIVFFLAGMSLADRPGEERYMLPIVPALWLLAARAVSNLSRLHAVLLPIGIAVIVAMPIFLTVQNNHTWTTPDTRVLAKEWIESNVPPDSKILMDGMRYRFIHSPPLTPNDATVDRRVNRAADAESVSRGVSDKTLALYAKAMSRMPGPKYDLHSTVYGLKVRDLSYYVDECFSYIVTSSQNSSRYASPQAEIKFPASARFYAQLPVDSRFQNVFSAAPKPWKVQGPEINVFKVLSTCT